MLHRRHALGLLALSPFAATNAMAAERQFFKKAAFEKALAEGRPVLVEIWAGWCPTCKAQEKILVNLAKQPKYGKLLMLTADFDVEKELLATLKVRNQSTLIAFKGGKEVTRSTGDTSAKGIEDLIDKTL